MFARAQMESAAKTRIQLPRVKSPLELPPDAAQFIWYTMNMTTPVGIKRARMENNILTTMGSNAPTGHGARRWMKSSI